MANVVLTMLDDPTFVGKVQALALQALQAPQVQQQILAYGDGLLDREFDRAMKKASGQISGVVRNPDLNPLAGIVRRDGSVNVKGIMGMFLQKVLAGRMGGEEAEGGITPISTGNPFHS